MKGEKISRGFTLIELLIVIGILATLATTVVLVLNPVQILSEARDGGRVSDVTVLLKALSFLIVNFSTVDMDGANSCSTNCFTHIDVDAAGGGGCGARHGGKTEISNVTSSNRLVDGTGWIPVNFQQITNAPISRLPVDPVNTTTYFYSYACDNAAKTFELDVNMESLKYQQSGTKDIESNTKDGGTIDSVFEKGSSLTL